MRPESQKLLDDIKSDREDIQLRAWTSASYVSTEVIPPLCELLASENMKIAKAADEALKTITHSVGRKLTGKRWKTVVHAYLRVLEKEYPVWSRAIAFRHLSLIADEKSVPAIAEWLHDEDLREEVVFCLERIPGEKATMALAKGLRQADDDFKPRILVALGHRKDPAALGAVMREFRSRNGKIALAAFAAYARIGVIPRDREAPVFPESVTSTPAERRKFVDSYLLYMDRLIENELDIEKDDVITHYVSCLEEAEQEHVRCAGVVSLAKYARKLGKEDIRKAVIKAIKPRLQDKSYIVRITTQKAMHSLES